MLPRYHPNRPVYTSGARELVRPTACSARSAARRRPRGPGAVAGAAERLAAREQELAHPVGVAGRARSRAARARRRTSSPPPRSVLARGAVARPLGVVRSPSRPLPARRTGMLGQLGHVRLGVAAYSSSSASATVPVQAQPPRGGKVLVERVAHEDVREAQTPAGPRARSDEPGLGSLVERGEELVLAQPARRPITSGSNSRPTTDASARTSRHRPTGAAGAPDRLQHPPRDRQPAGRPLPSAASSCRSPWRTADCPASRRGSRPRGRRRGIAHRACANTREVSARSVPAA